MSGCDVKQRIQTTKFLPDIYINGKKLDKSRLAQEIQYHPAANFYDAMQQAANFYDAMQQAAQALILRELLREQARDAIASGTREEDAIAALIAAHVPPVTIRDSDCENYYRQNPARFSGAPKMRVRHILLPAAKDDAEARHIQKKQAERIIADLQQAPDLHHAFCARLHLSRCPSRTQEGLLGELMPGQTVPEFERQIYALDEGLAPQPIATRYGWHVVWIEHKQPGTPAAYEDVRDDIKNWLHARRERQAVADYLYGLVAQAKIDGIELRPQEENIVLQ